MDNERGEWNQRSELSPGNSCYHSAELATQWQERGDREGTLPSPLSHDFLFGHSYYRTHGKFMVHYNAPLDCVCGTTVTVL